MEAAMMTIDQAHERIGKDNITRQSLYLAVQRGELPAIHIGRRILIRRAAFEEFLLGSRKVKENSPVLEFSGPPFGVAYLYHSAPLAAPRLRGRRA